MKPFYEDAKYLIPFSEILWINKAANRLFFKNKADGDSMYLSVDQCKKLTEEYEKWLLSQFSSTIHEISLQWVKVTLRRITT